jgi:beta-lactamase regulating signal transducer with metallopeptidase domain
MTANQFLELAVSVSAQAALVVTVAHWVGKLADNESARCRLWTVCYALLLALVAAGLLLPHARWLRPWSGLDAAHAAILAGAELQLGRLVVVIWLTGVGGSLLLFAIRSFQSHRFLSQCEPIDVEQLGLPELTEAKPQSTHHSRRPGLSILTNRRLSTPFCWQFHAPYIILPEFLLGLDRRELQFIIKHELAHLRAGHPVQLLLQRVVEIIFWFHPMVWWASHQSTLSREFACDAAAIDSPSDIALYLRTLLTIVEHAAAEPPAPARLAFGREKNTVAERARRLVRLASRPTPGRPGFSPQAAVIALLAGSAVAGQVWLPVDLLASPRSDWSPWPSWTSAVLHDFGVSVRDFDAYDPRSSLHELREAGTLPADAAPP